MLFSNEKAINCFIIASSYVAARAMFYGSTQCFSSGCDTTPSDYGACLNPAIAIGITLSSIIGNGFGALEFVWIYPLMPFVGSLAALLFYEFVFKKTQEMLNHDHADQAHDINAEDALLETHD